MTNVMIAHFESFNQRRYSTPWVCKVDSKGKYDFSCQVGIYTGNGRKGEAGDLVVYSPAEGQVYAYGQKDYRGNNTQNKCVLWNGEEFIPCDKLGRLIKGEE